MSNKLKISRRCRLLWLWFTVFCTHAGAGSLVDRDQLHDGGWWTYNYFIGEGYYFHYSFKFTRTLLPFKISRYQIQRFIHLYQVPVGANCHRQAGYVRLPGGHLVTEEEYQQKLFKGRYKLKEGGLLHKMYRLAHNNGMNHSDGSSALAISSETYNLNSFYVLQNYQIHVALPGMSPVMYWHGMSPVMYWYGIDPDTSTESILARPGHTAQNTQIMNIEPNTHLVLGLPTLLEGGQAPHELQLTLFEATDNLQGYVQLHSYQPQISCGKLSVRLVLKNHELEQKGGGSIFMMINPNGIIWNVSVRFEQPNPDPFTPSYYRKTYYPPKRDDDFGSPPGGAAGFGTSLFVNPIQGNYVNLIQPFIWELLRSGFIKSKWSRY